MIPTPIEAAKALFAIHHHADTVCTQDPNQIVYREAELIALLKKHGWPEPDWAGYAQKMQDFIQQVVKDNLISHPGETIRDCMKHHILTVEELAPLLYPDALAHFENNDLLISYVTDIIEGRKRVSNSFAARLEKVFKIDKGYWIDRQRVYEEKVVTAAAQKRDNPFK